MAYKKSKATLPTIECDYILLDISNLLYASFFVNKGEDVETTTGLAIHMGLTTVNKYYKQFKPKKGVVMAFDRRSWRKEYTASDLCISKKPYKGQRRKDMSVTQQKKYEEFLAHLGEFENIIVNHSTVITLMEPRLEADDLIAGFVQNRPDDMCVIVSTDTDFMQLLKLPNVRIVSPSTDKETTLEEYDNNAKFYLFQKCLRGDPGDNVQAAYPGVRMTRIKEAYTDPFKRVSLMKETWKHEDGTEFQVEKLFEENDLLINLEAQPEPIRKLIEEVIERETTRQKKFSLFHFVKFLHKFELKKIADSFTNYLPMLSK